MYFLFLKNLLGEKIFILLKEDFLVKLYIMKKTLKSSFIKRSDKAPWKEVENETLILNLTDGNYFGLNQTGFFVWKLLDGSKNLSDIAKAVANRYKISLKKAYQDTEVLLEELKKSDLIELT